MKKLDVAGLKERLRRTPPAFAVYGDDGTGREQTGLTAAAVLVPIVLCEPEMSVIFTQRTMHLKAHSGQVSFPGGRAEPRDPTPEFTFSFGETVQVGSTQCSLVASGGTDSFSSCSSPYAHGVVLADGDYVFKVRAADELGNVGTAAAFPFALDIVARSTLR